VQRFAKPREETLPDELDVDADAVIVRELYPRLRRFAAVVGFPVVEPDDLVQEVLERTLRVSPLHVLEDPFSYLRRAIVNRAANARRSTRRQGRAFARLTRSAEPTVESYPSDLAMLAAIAPDVRAVLYLAEVEGRPYAEIGDLLGCSETAARTRAARGRRALRSVLEAGDA
jgi:RNA polymerase sigma-70 factor (ECF subfamily)